MQEHYVQQKKKWTPLHKRREKKITDYEKEYHKIKTSDPSNLMKKVEK